MLLSPCGSAGQGEEMTLATTSSWERRKKQTNKQETVGNQHMEVNTWVHCL